METKHTLGEWEVTNPKDALDTRWIYAGESKLAVVYGGEDIAHLIAASPALLTALKGCRDMLRESAKQFRQLNDKGHAVMADRHADNANAAIAKAENTWEKLAELAGKVIDEA